MHTGTEDLLLSRCVQSWMPSMCLFWETNLVSMIVCPPCFYSRILSMHLFSDASWNLFLNAPVCLFSTTHRCFYPRRPGGAMGISSSSSSFSPVAINGVAINGTPTAARNTRGAVGSTYRAGGRRSERSSLANGSLAAARVGRRPSELPSTELGGEWVEYICMCA